MREMTCIVCPIGCQLRADPTKMTVSGNRCTRGRKYALEELTSPRRTVTSTIRIIHYQKPEHDAQLSAMQSALVSGRPMEDCDRSAFKPLVDFFCPSANHIEGRLPVKTAQDVPKDRIEDIMQAIHHLVVTTPIHMGDVIIDNIADTGVALIATRTLLEL